MDGRDGHARPPFLVLGLGNELFTDEGVGVAAACRLARLDLPGVEVLDGGTLGLALLPELEGREGLLLLDALLLPGGRPGEVAVLTGDELPGAHVLLTSAHQLGVVEALAAAELAGRAPGRVAAVGMVPSSLETGYGLTPLAAARVGAMVSRAAALLATWLPGGREAVARA
jgi:hydrogenase maturation protease